MTPQERMRGVLAKTGIPAKEIKVYGSQIMVTSWSRDAADKWAALLAKFAKVNGVKESLDYNQVNRNTVLRPTTHPVWLTWATM